MNSEYQRVLAALNLESPVDIPIAAGHRLAREHRAEFRVVAAIRHSLLITKGFFNATLIDRESVMQEARSAADSRLEALGPEPPPVDIKVGDPAEVIAAVARQRSSDLIVIGSRARSRSEYVMGTTATSVLRLAEGIDIYACHRDDPQIPIDNVIIAIDGSSITEQVLADSSRFLNPTGASNVHVVCVVPEASSRADRVFHNCMAYLASSPWAALEVRIKQQDVTHSLEAAIREHDADLLIIGSGENLGIGWAIGSTTNELLHDVSCDVLVIRP